MIVHFYSVGGVKTPSVLLNFFKSGNSGVNSFLLDPSIPSDSSKTDLFEPLFIERIVSKIAIKKTRLSETKLASIKGSLILFQFQSLDCQSPCPDLHPLIFEIKQQVLEKL